MRYRLRTLMILLAGLPPAIWGGYQLCSRPMPVEPILSPSEFESTIASRSVVIYLDVDWSLQAIESRPVVAQLEDAISNDPRLADMRFRRIDCTSQEGPLWEALEAWFAKQPGGRPAIYLSGCGSILWIVDGQIEDSVLNAAETGFDELFVRTLRVSKR